MRLINIDKLEEGMEARDALFDSEGVRIDAVEIDLKVEGDIMVESVRSGVPEMEPLGSLIVGAGVESEN